MEGAEIEVAKGVGDEESAGAVVTVFFGGHRGSVAALGGKVRDDLANTSEDTGFVFVAFFGLVLLLLMFRCSPFVV